MDRIPLNRSERKLSQSLTNIPTVLVTDPGCRKHSLLQDSFEDETRCHSTPCSPQLKRRAFTTCIAGTRYLIVANPPEKAKDDSNLQSKNGQLAPESLPKGTGSLTVLRRSNSRTKVVSNNSSRTSSVASLESDSYASVDLGTDKLPPVDVPEASHVCSLRLKHIVRKLQKEDISKEDLLKNLEYAAQVLETVYIDETSRCRECSSEAICKCRQRKNDSRRLCDEEDELSEVEPDAVPTEVRDWLALTFTRE
ncbi:uncharacterized protein LOC128241542 isoform X5 [Mya arenaria]|uniref:uncharacterized protein LOC128241542 isoform X5 n=1 Tax=Mya arenaria TaxID=6604 RepID=UPI0022E50C6B|nr:uncharacterized protein LOC128241542 isoform X5 [Mya arenaria]